jgi:transcriptional regulator with XRE-family HTH domain
LLRAIQGARIEKALSFADLSAMSGVDASQVSRICRGQFVTFGDSVVRICMVLGLSLSDNVSRTSSSTARASRKDVGWAKIERSVRRAWDETPAGADQLARIISAVAKISGR